MTWLLVPSLWTLGATAVAPPVGRILGHADAPRLTTIADGIDTPEPR